MSNAGDFVIKDGVLKKYTGTKKNIVIPDGVTKLGRCAFRDCSTIESVTVPDGVDTIGDYAFENCGSLAAVTIPESTTVIGKYIFSNCPKLESVYFKNRTFGGIPDGYAVNCTLSGFAANRKNDSPSEEIISSYVEFIKEKICSYRFSDFIIENKDVLRFAADYSALTAEEAERLLSLLPEKGNTEERAMLIEYINTHTEQSDTMSIDRIPLSEVLKEWRFTKNRDGSVKLTKYIGSGRLVCPSEICGKPVTGIGTGTFFRSIGAPNISSLILPEGLLSLDYGAVSGCRRLCEISIPASLTNMGSFSFGLCDSLTKVNISPENNRFVFEDGVIFNKDKTELIECLRCVNGRYTVPDGVKVIRESAFKACDGLVSVTLPDSVTSIGDKAFEMCSELTSINIPDGAAKLGSRVFNHCGRLTSVTLPRALKSLGENSFGSCLSLTSITIPEGVERLGDGAFFSCTDLTEIILPESLMHMGKDVFKYCKKLKKVYIPPKNSRFSFEGGVIFNKDKTELIICLDIAGEFYTVPDSVKRISDYAFSGCSKLIEVTVPDGVTRIGTGTFNNCPELTSALLPDSVTAIGERAFRSCEALKAVYAGKNAEIEEDAFDDCPELEIIRR